MTSGACVERSGRINLKRNEPLTCGRGIWRTLLWHGAAAAFLVASLNTATVMAQQPRGHYLQRADSPPGSVGRSRLARGGNVVGYYQPVQITSSEGSMISPAIDGHFGNFQPAPLLVGLLIGDVYRFRITQIPLHEGIEIYPTIELIDRLYPPEGLATQYPIPIELTLEELSLAIEGKMVTRVIYVENPQGALPRPEGPHQRYFESRTDEDPLELADQLGRPVAILRIGSRLPDAAAPDDAFLFGSPPVMLFSEGLHENQWENLSFPVNEPASR